MVRSIDPVLLAAMSRPVWHPVLFLRLDWPGGTVHAHSNTGTITWGGSTWMGVGRFGSVSSPVEGSGISASPITVNLAGIPPELLDETMGVRLALRGRAATVSIGATEHAGHGALIGTPYPVLAGYVDAMRYVVTREDGGTDHAVQLDIGVGPPARSTAVVTHSAEDQGRRHPGDTAGRHLVEVARRVQVLTWPE